ncbi:MAG: NADH-quinone oxidoreductase subunit NuoE [Limnochordia bacterium]|jgi:NADH-quinone oxidoreductase subunit E
MALAVDRQNGTANGDRLQLEQVNRAIETYGCKKASLIPILQRIQEIYHYLPEDILTYVGTVLEIPPATVFGVATFYAQFALEPKGKYVIRVCDGTACHVRRSMPVLKAIREKLGLAEGMKTTRDGLFTVETVSCLGACGLAPVLMINDQIHGQMTPEAVDIILDEIMKREGGEVA